MSKYSAQTFKSKDYGISVVSLHNMSQNVLMMAINSTYSPLKINI